MSVVCDSRVEEAADDESEQDDRALSKEWRTLSDG